MLNILSLFPLVNQCCTLYLICLVNLIIAKNISIYNMLNQNELSVSKINNNKMLSLTVVIATLGGEGLRGAILNLNNGEAIPEEILVCIPKSLAKNLDLSEFNNVRILETPCRGQVAQRAFGLKEARCPYVMQLDDDVIISNENLERILSLMKFQKSPMAISPLFRDSLTGDYLTEYKNNLKGFLRSCVASLIGGAPWGARRMGCIDPSGMPYAVDPAHCQSADYFEVEWLPGGCVVSQKENLVIDDYYPFNGKAFSEDVIHSLIWRKSGVSLCVAPNIEVFTNISKLPLTSDQIKADYDARRYVVTMMGGSLVRCWLWFIWFNIREKTRGLLKEQ
jgi:hypothetical protein